MTDATLGILINGIAPTLAALGALFVAMRNGAKTDNVSDKTDSVAKKADQIHDLTNSTMSQMRLELATAMTEITGLKALVAEQGRSATSGDATRQLQAVQGQKEALETRLMAGMQEAADAQVALARAELSPAIGQPVSAPTPVIVVNKKSQPANVQESPDASTPKD